MIRVTTLVVELCSTYAIVQLMLLKGVNRGFLETSAKTQKGADLAIRKENWQFPKTDVNYGTGKNIDRLELAWRANHTAE